MIPASSTCSGVNTSPELDWTAGPAGTMSYAMVLTDTANNLVHWVLWDIPAATRSLPAALAADAMLANPAGAKQVSIASAGHAFSGPCPPAGSTHVYQFAVHALDVATLPNVTTTTAGATVKAQVLAHALASGTLSANGMR